MVATVGLLAIPARANFTGPGVTLSPSKYWGGNTFVPGEQMAINLYATGGDSIDVTIQNASGNPSSLNSGIVVGNSGTTTFHFTIPSAWADGDTYQVVAHDTTSGQTRPPVPFAIQQYNDQIWTDQRAYLPGDTVTIHWAVVYEQNMTPVPSGSGAIQVQDTAGNSLLAAPHQYNFSASQSSFAFALNSSLATPDAGTVFFWFNDTANIRHVTDTTGFGIGNLGVTVNLLQPSYSPGETVTANIRTRITGGFGNPAEPNIPVAVNVTDLNTGNVVAAYSATGLSTDSTGLLSYVFQLAMTPTSGDYQVTATATAHGTLSASASAQFTVVPTPYLSVQVSLDKLQYLSGDTIHATAKVITSETLPLTYTWTVIDTVTGNTLALQPGSATTTYDFAIPATYAGRLEVLVDVNDGNGTTAGNGVFANVAYGYLSLNLNKAQFNPGDTLVATFSLQSAVITNPTYFWQVDDSAGHTITSGSTTTGTASFVTPSPTASPSYTFIVTANQNGRSAQAQQTAYQASGYFLSVSLDRQNYNPGDTITIAYTLTARGTSALPSQYRFSIGIFGVTSASQTTTSQTGTLTLVVPQGAPTGDEILQVIESNTGASTLVVVHIGAINPLLTEVAGVPLFDILIFLLFVVLLLAVILLWRRTGMGKAPSAGEVGKPTTPPPPPPAGPSQQAAGPMSVACKHCGASIEITTSKRPIEVMCPSCGETQVVQ